MKKYLKEVLITIVQLLVFCLIPLTGSDTDMFGVLVLMLLLTCFISIVCAISIKNKKYQYCFPLITALLFIPAIYIYYNDSAFIWSFIYFISSSIGIIIGKVVRRIICEI